MTAPGSGLRVLNGGCGVPTAVVARLLAAAGAEVCHGDGVTRTEARYPGLGLWFGGGTAGSTRELLRDGGEWDVILVGGEQAPKDLAVLPTPEEILAAHPRSIVLEVSGFLPGVTDAPPAADLLVQARIGMADELFTDRPCPVAFAPSLYGSALLGAIGTWAALVDRLATGRGQVVRATLQQGAALFWPHLWLRGDQPSPEFDAVPPRDVRHLVFRCHDGRWVQLVLGVVGAMGKLSRALGIPGASDPAARGVPDPSRGPGDYFAERTPIAAAVAELDSGQVLERLAREGIPAGLVSTLTEALSDEQALAVDLVEIDAAGNRWGAVPIEIRPVGDGAHRRGRAGWRPSGTGAGPLSGLRVVDFGDWVSGPFATRLLADLGADVVSVDPPTGLSNLTGVRNTIVSNAGKRSIICDLKSERGRAVARRLATTADVVCQNFRPGVAERLGVDAGSARVGNPAAVYLHTTAFGDRGPRSGQGGFDMVAQALCGHEIRAAGLGNPPLWTRSPFVDYAAGALGAVGVLAALYGRLVDGSARDVHTSLLGAGLFLRSDCYVDHDGTAHGQVVLDSAGRGFAPTESLYRTSDGWIAVDVRDAVAAGVLAEAVGQVAEADFRLWGEPERARIGQWLRGRSTAEALGCLADLGVWAARCRRDAIDELRDSRRPDGAPFVAEVVDARYGTLRGMFGPQVQLSRYPCPGARRASAPAPGEHTAHVLAELESQSRSRRVGAVRNLRTRRSPMPTENERKSRTNRHDEL